MAVTAWRAFLRTRPHPAARRSLFLERCPANWWKPASPTDRRSFATGELDAILEPSPERVVPGCEYVPRCGGCQYQHASAASQLQMKLDILKETLARAHVPVPAEIGSLTGPPWGYRNRIRLHVMKRAGSRWAIAGEDRTICCRLPIVRSPLPFSNRRSPRSHALAQRPASIACAMKWNSLPTASRTSCSSRSGRERQPRQPARLREQALEAFAERLHTQLPVLTGVGLFAEGEMMHWGQRSLTYTVSGHPYQASLGGFFQVNRFLLPGLLQLAVENSDGENDQAA